MSPTSPIPIRTFYRIVWMNPPEIDDFRSHVALGIAPRIDDREIRRLASGISVFRTAAQARKVAMKRPPWWGRGFVVRIDVPFDSEDGMVIIERTTKSAGHYTMWAEAALIATWVVDIMPVSENEEPAR